MRFEDEYFFLSNMYPLQFTVKEVKYTSSESYYQARKASNLNDFLKIANSKPFVSKQLGRKVKIVKNWNDIRIKVMEEALYYKFNSSLELREKLISTSNLPLVEDNTWNDKFWGVCNGKGENNLGKLLMELREKIKEEKNEI